VEAIRLSNLKRKYLYFGKNSPGGGNGGKKYLKQNPVKVRKCSCGRITDLDNLFRNQKKINQRIYG